MPKSNQIADLRKMNVDDLIKLGENKRAELFALKFQAVLGSLEQTHRIKEIKHEIARIELVLSEMKKSGQNTNKTFKGDYSAAVADADKAGKAVREKQMKMIQDMQNQQMGTATTAEPTTDEAKSEPVKASVAKPADDKKEAAKPAAKKPAAKKTTAKKTTTAKKGETK